MNGEVWDLDRPFEGNSTLHLLKFDDDEGMLNQNSKCNNISIVFLLDIERLCPYIHSQSFR